MEFTYQNWYEKSDVIREFPSLAEAQRVINIKVRYLLYVCIVWACKPKLWSLIDMFWTKNWIANQNEEFNTCEITMPYMFTLFVCNDTDFRFTHIYVPNFCHIMLPNLIKFNSKYYFYIVLTHDRMFVRKTSTSQHEKTAKLSSYWRHPAIFIIKTFYFMCI